jgi:hypothetical protein
MNATASQDPGASRAYSVLKAPERGVWMPGPVLVWGGRQNGQTSGEILPTHMYCNEEKRRYGLLLGLLHFRLVAPHLQPGVVGPYPICGVRFPCCLLLEGISHIQNFVP